MEESLEDRTEVSQKKQKRKKKKKGANASTAESLDNANDSSWKCVKRVSRSPSHPFEIECYASQSNSNKPLVVLNKVPGPLTSVAIFFSTEADNSKGLPHCLEHLVFLGSKSVPYRGYLDVLASRCVSLGTNASTGLDHTCYTVSCAGSVGLLQILPTFLSFILQPTLTDSNYLTEVYHVDGQGKEQGVVYCEMLGREKTESDLLSFNFNQLMYPGTGYSYETGGLTKDIATLTNTEIRDYHNRFYCPENMKILIQGEVKASEVFAALEKFDFNYSREASSSIPKPWSTPIPDLKTSDSRTVEFPSEDESVGSVTLGWRGPSITDTETCVALEVLFRYLQETPASPIQQRFVECSDPLASYVAYSLNHYKVTSLYMTFGGVSTGAKGENDEEDEDEDEDDEEEEDDDEDEEDEASLDNEESMDDTFNPDLMAPNSMKDRVLDLLTKIYKTGIAEGPEYMKKVVQRHRVKFLEEVEDDPFDIAEHLLLPELIFPSSSDYSHIGSRMSVLKILDVLETKNDSFWLELMNKWILQAQMIEVIMKPSGTLAAKNSEQFQVEIDERKNKLGNNGLKEKAKALEKATAENKTPLPDDIRETFPNIPSTASISKVPLSTKMIMNADCGFPIQMLKTSSNFYHCRMAFYLEGLPVELKPYIVLFQELLTETGLSIPQETTKQNLQLSYTDATRLLAEETVSMYCGLGFGNDTFSCGYLSDTFFIYGVVEPTKIQFLFKWIRDLIFYTIFPIDRIKTLINNLLSDISEELREGDVVCQALGVASIFDSKSNDVFISLFKQKSFLSKLKQQIKEPAKAKEIIKKLNQFRKYLVSDLNRIFVQISCPMNGIADDQVLGHFAKNWQHGVNNSGLVNDFPTTKKQKIQQENFTAKVPLPAPSLNIANSYMLAMGSVDSSFLEQYVSCPITKKDPDYYPVLVLNEILSTSEGPLWNEIRGKGLAYDARLETSVWPPFLTFSLYESSEPAQALDIFYKILKSVTEKNSKLLQTFTIDTAKASLLFNFHNARSTAAGVIENSLKSFFMGFKSYEEEQNLLKQLESVTKEDILRVFSKYHSQFFEPSKRVTVITTNPSTEAEVKKAFAKHKIVLEEPPFNK